MRRLLLSLLPVTVLGLACMQGPPGMSDPGDDEGGRQKLSDPDCRIGGTSVGCGNPTKSVADMPLGAWECGALRCPTSGYPDLEFTVTPGKRLGFALRPWDEETLQGLPAPDSVSALSVKVRYGNQLWLLDSTALVDTLFAITDSLGFAFDRVCQALDNPSRICTDNKWSEIPITLELEQRIYALGEDLDKKAYVHDLVLLPEGRVFSWKKGGLDPKIHFASEPIGKSDSTLALNSLVGDQQGYRILFIPGTDKTSVLCKDLFSPALNGLPVGSHPLRILDIPADLDRAWVPVFSLDTLYRETKVDSFFLDAAFSSAIRKQHCP